MVSLAVMLMGSRCIFVVAVVLPQVQAEFEISRAQASLPYTLMMIGFGVGGLFMGRVVDRFGVTVALWIGACGIFSGLLARVSVKVLRPFRLRMGFCWVW